MLAGGMLFTACEKSPDAQPDVPKMPKTNVTFTLSDFTVSEGALGKAGSSVSAVGDTLKNYANHLYYRVYDASGALLKAKSQTSNQGDFGVVNDSLAQGNYTVVFVASKSPLSFANTSLSTDHFLDPSNTHWDDMFLRKMSITVGTSPISQSVRLDRIVAGLQLNLEEDPNGAFPGLSITLETEDSAYQLSNLTSSGPVVKTRQWTLYFGANTKSVFMPVLNTNRPVKVIFRIYNRVNQLVGERIVENVRFYANKRTVFSGRLTQDVEFKVGVDPVWYPQEPVQF